MFAFVFATWLLYSRQLAFAEPPKRGMRHNWNPQTGRVSVRTSLTHSKPMYTKKGLKDIKKLEEAFLLLVRKIPVVACLKFGFVFGTWLLYIRQLAFAEPPKHGVRHN